MSATSFYCIARQARDRMGPGHTIDTGEGIPMVVIAASYGRAPSTEAVIERKALPQEVTLTSDGRGAITGVWHTGPEANLVFVERWDARGRTFHGWIDGASRMLVQAG